MESSKDLVRIDIAGNARPWGEGARKAMRARVGSLRVLDAPDHVLLLARTKEDGSIDEASSPRIRLAGEITAPGVLCDIVALVTQLSWKGELVVFDGVASRWVFFEAGNVVASRSNAGGERIGEVMKKHLALDDAQVDAVVQKLKTSAGRRFGEAAVDLGFLTHDRLFHMMGTQTEEIFHACLRVRSGTFYFLEGFDDARIAAHYSTSARELLLTGIRHLDEVEFFRPRIPSGAHVPVRIPGRTQPPPELAPALRACDGRRSVAEIAAACDLTEFEATQRMFELVHSSFVRITAPRPAELEALIAVFNDVMRAIFRAAPHAEVAAALRAAGASFTSQKAYEDLYAGAGLSQDGTVNAEAVARNTISHGGEEPAAFLTRRLHQHVSFMLFSAGSLLPRDVHQALNKDMRERLLPLAPKARPSFVASEEIELPPPSIAMPTATTTPTSTATATPTAAAEPTFDHEPDPFAAPPSAPIDAAPSPPTEAQPLVLEATPPAAAPSPAPTRSRAVPIATTTLLLGFVAAAALYVWGRPATPPSLVGAISLAPTSSPISPPSQTALAAATRSPSIASSPSLEATSAPPPSASTSPASSTASSAATAATAATAAPETPEIPTTMAVLRTPPPGGNRVFFDGRVVGNTPEAITVRCGTHVIKIGSAGTEQTLDLPCGAALDVHR